MAAPFSDFSGIAAPMPGANINTDAIIPSAWLRTATADYGKGLFGRQRYDDEGRERPGFVLNREPFRHAEILVAGPNFGCGSSREAAVWALAGFGLKCVLAPSFADIFYENAYRNGLLVARIDPETLVDLIDFSSRSAEPRLGVNLANETLDCADGRVWRMSVPPSRKQALMLGEDEIECTLRHERDISAFHAAASAQMPWLYLRQ
ncbi:MAG: 3-isopropylmalate dehydratase small subunit [Hyphomicrobiaceae bacterium]